MRRIHFIFNPVAGNGLSTRAFAQMEELLNAQNIPYTVSRSEYAGHAPLLTQQALEAAPECIVAVGGDGTVREVASAMVGSDVPLCVLPCGTGNDIVRALHIPEDPAAVMGILLNGVPCSMDACTANGQYYFNVAGFGFDVDVLANTERYKKRFRGLTAYMFGLLRALFKLKLREVRVETEDGNVIKSNALIVAACNGTHFGGGMNVAPEADPTDGLMDVCIVSNVNRITVLRVLTKFVKGKHLSLPITRYFKAHEISVYSDPPSSLQLDGEIVGQTPVRFQIVPGALRVLRGLSTQQGS